MKRAVLLLAMACQADSDDYPIAPGGGGPIGGGGGGGGGGDAGVNDGGDGGAGDGDAGLQLTGKVCLLTDLRDLTTLTRCDDARASGLVVTLGNRTAVTDRGAFTITAPRGAGFTWHVAGARDEVIVRTAMPFGTDNTIPAISFVLYRELLSTNSANVAPLQGSIIVRVVRGTTGVSAVTATLAGQDLVLYDGVSLLDWNTGTVGTGAAGVVWIPGIDVPVPSGPLSLTLSPPGAATVPVSATVEDQTITFVTTDLP